MDDPNMVGYEGEEEEIAIERSPTEMALSINLSNFLSIRDMAPLEIAVPLYGYILPVVVMITVVTNSFIVLVLSQPQLRTSTNIILLAMAVMELLTGLASFPWMLYYYTFGGYIHDARRGMPAFWCRASPYFAELLPTVFHTGAIWLTVYLAIQRYWFVCSTSHRRSLIPGGANPISLTRCRMAIATICVTAILVELPMMFGKYTKPLVTIEYTFCVVKISDWVLKLGPNYFYSVYYWFLVIFVHAGPCSLLVIFGGLLIQTVHGAVKRRRESLGYLLRERDRSTTSSSCSGNNSSSSNLHATTKMLVVVIVIFLITEIPAAVIFTLHVLANTFQILPIDSYHSMNVALIFRNVFILISYPFNFAVYLSMSYQFRHTVRRLFCRQSNLFDVNCPPTTADQPRRSTVHDGKGFLCKNNNTFDHVQKRSSPLPISSTNYRQLGNDRRRFSLIDNPFLKNRLAPINDQQSIRKTSTPQLRIDGSSAIFSDNHPLRYRVGDESVNGILANKFTNDYSPHVMTTTEYTPEGGVRTTISQMDISRPNGTNYSNGRRGSKDLKKVAFNADQLL